MDVNPLLTALVPRLRFVIEMAKAGLPGGQLSILVLLALEAGKELSGMEISRQGRNSAAQLLEQAKSIARDEHGAHLHPEVRAKFGIESVFLPKGCENFLEWLSAGAPELSKPKNYYACKADGTPASKDDQEVLESQLLEAIAYAVYAATGRPNAEILQSYTFGQSMPPIERRLVGLARILAGLVEGRLESINGRMSELVLYASRTIGLNYPEVLNPHALLQDFREMLEGAARKRPAKKNTVEKCNDDPVPEKNQPKLPDDDYDT